MFAAQVNLEGGALYRGIGAMRASVLEAKISVHNYASFSRIHRSGLNIHTCTLALYSGQQSKVTFPKRLFTPNVINDCGYYVVAKCVVLQMSQAYGKR